MGNIKYNRVLVVSDNLVLINAFFNLTAHIENLQVDYACTKWNLELINSKELPVKITGINIKSEQSEVSTKYNLIFSLHCKQLFPDFLVKNVKCINIHPGYNPYNRGWFPQVFSIINGFPAGATINEIDEHLDHGLIIDRREIKINSWDTSIDVYNRVQELEIELLRKNLISILDGTYNTTSPEIEGNINLKKDFNELCHLNLDEVSTVGNTLNVLRALTHGKYPNAFFTDPDTGKKIFVKILLTPESEI